MAANSVSLPATRILTEALRHLRYLILEELTERCSEALSLDSISWILTVPAIWNKSTRQLMKEIAIEVCKNTYLSNNQFISDKSHLFITNQCILFNNTYSIIILFFSGWIG